MNRIQLHNIPDFVPDFAIYPLDIRVNYGDLIRRRESLSMETAIWLSFLRQRKQNRRGNLSLLFYGPQAFFIIKP